MQPSKWPDVILPSYRPVKSNSAAAFSPARVRRVHPYIWPHNRQPPPPMDAEWYSAYLYPQLVPGTRSAGLHCWPPPLPPIASTQLNAESIRNELCNYLRLGPLNNPVDRLDLRSIDENYIPAAAAAAAFQSATAIRPLNIAPPQMHPAPEPGQPMQPALYYLPPAGPSLSALLPAVPAADAVLNSPCVANSQPTLSQCSTERPVRTIIPKTDTTNHFHIFVGDLSSDVDTDTLRQAFQSFGDISDCRVVRDQYTHHSKGYGFVAFRCQTEASTALNAMNNQRLGDRPVRTRWAFRKPPAIRSERPAQLDYERLLESADAQKRTVYCCASVTEFPVTAAEILTKEKLTVVFGAFGAIEEMRVFGDKSYAFIRFAAKEAGARAIVALHQTDWNGQRLKCAWSKS